MVLVCDVEGRWKMVCLRALFDGFGEFGSLDFSWWEGNAGEWREMWEERQADIRQETMRQERERDFDQFKVMGLISMFRKW